jgi:osmoprotectant transport system ATP-binding protein
MPLHGRSAITPPALDLRAEAVEKRYGSVLALAGPTLDIGAGECVALVGESGSGKTTLLRMFNRMVEPDVGRILVNGQPAATLDPIPLRRRIGYVQQDGGLIPHWRVLRNVSLVPWLRGEPGADPAAEALRMVGLPAEEYGARWPRELSGGQRQRVALARALAARPAALLLDEPFGALDAITRAEIQESFATLRRRLRVTTVLVTHDLREALLLADRVAVLRAGSLEQVADRDALLRAPATPYVKHLLDHAGQRAS